MLRRAPTTIQLSQADIDHFEALQRRKQQEKQRRAEQVQGNTGRNENTSTQADALPVSVKDQQARIMGGGGGK